MDETRDLVAFVACLKLLTVGVWLLLMLHAEWEATSKPASKLTSGDVVLCARQEEVKTRLIMKTKL